ncbi:MAG: transposase [Chloroflexi bacterium]|nr:transposase [Chloroflexota bacterium]
MTDQQWEILEPLIPKQKPGRGRPRADDRRTLNGILFVLKTGCQWKDMPEEFGDHVTCWRRLDRWQRDGTWSGSGGRCWGNWMRKASWNGPKRFWMGVSPR